MIKLTFSKFTFTTDGTTSKGTIVATIKYYLNGNYKTVASKAFKTKVTLKKGDKPNLNKAYKYIIAKLEKDAYIWANIETFMEITRTQKILNTLDDFSKKAIHVIAHDTEYLKSL